MFNRRKKPFKMPLTFFTDKDFAKAADMAGMWAKEKADQRLVPFRCACTGDACVLAVERKFGQVHFDIVDICESLPMAEEASKIPAAMQLDVSHIDLSGFACPSCRRLGRSGRNDMQFIRCGKCHSLVCAGATVDEITRDGRTIYVFHCHPGCGSFGITTPHPSGTMLIDSMTQPQFDLQKVLAPPSSPVPRLGTVSKSTPRLSPPGRK
jgi:hypothetical protein